MEKRGSSLHTPLIQRERKHRCETSTAGAPAFAVFLNSPFVFLVAFLSHRTIHMQWCMRRPPPPSFAISSSSSPLFLAAGVVSVAEQKPSVPRVLLVLFRQETMAGLVREKLPEPPRNPNGRVVSPGRARVRASVCVCVCSCVSNRRLPRHLLASSVGDSFGGCCPIWRKTASFTLGSLSFPLSCFSPFSVVCPWTNTPGAAEEMRLLGSPSSERFALWGLSLEVFFLSRPRDAAANRPRPGRNSFSQTFAHSPVSSSLSFGSCFRKEEMQKKKKKKNE